MRKKIGIYFSANKSSGGAYQYAVSVLNALIKTDNEIYVYNLSLDLPQIKKNKRVHIINIRKNDNRIVNFRNNISYFVAKNFQWSVRLVYTLGVLNIFSFLFKLMNRRIIYLIDSKNLDIIFFPIPVLISSMIKTCAVISILDLEHLSKSRIAETTLGGRYEYREFLYKKISRKAWRTFVDSEKSKQIFNKHYKVDNSVVLKYIPPIELKPLKLASDIKSAKEKFRLINKYVFYPAKFWPHKNHINLVKAVELLNKSGISIDLVLTGAKDADYGIFDKLQKYTKDHKLDNVVKYFGYVSYGDLSYLYENALCMAMPTFIGPTNIPVYEAWRMRTPVIYSDIDGCREQLGNAGILVNPTNPNEIASAIERLYKSNKLRQDLIQKGLRKLSEWTEKDFDNTIQLIIRQA